MGDGRYRCVSGALMRTNKGELSVHADNVVLLNKTALPLPEKFHGITDQEIRYRQRYVDLVMNEDTRGVFRTRSMVMQTLREFLISATISRLRLMMHSIPGGATARPFVTHHNTLDMPFYLRVAPELFLKRLWWRIRAGYEIIEIFAMKACRLDIIQSSPCWSFIRLTGLPRSDGSYR